MRRMLAFLAPLVFLLSILVDGNALGGQRDWTGVKAWEGSVSMVRHRVGERSVPLGAVGKQVVKSEVNQTLRCNVRYVDPYAEDEPFVYWAGGGFPVNVTIEDSKKVTTYKGDQVDMIETVKEKGSGQPPTEEVDSSFGIDRETKTYGFTISPAEYIEVLHAEKVTGGNGVVVREASARTKASDSVGVTVENQPLPSSGMNLAGKTILEDGTSVTWDLKPVY